MDASSHHAMGAQIAATPHDSDGELGVDRALGDAQPLGDRAMRQTLDPAQAQDLAATRRERAHRVGEQGEFLFMAEDLRGIGSLFYNGQLLHIA